MIGHHMVRLTLPKQDKFQVFNSLVCLLSKYRSKAFTLSEFTLSLSPFSEFCILALILQLLHSFFCEDSLELKDIQIPC